MEHSVEDTRQARLTSQAKACAGLSRRKNGPHPMERWRRSGRPRFYRRP